MKILLAVDGSPFAEVALREVARRPWPEGTEVRVVTVDAPLSRSTFSAGSKHRSAYDEIVSAQRDEANSHLDESLALLRDLAPQLTQTAALLEGSPREEIAREAELWGADLLVVGSRGHGAVKSVLLGSVSLALVLQAPCSVLVVRSPESPASA